MLTIGCHLSTTKGYAAMGETARSIGANTFAFFTRNPRGGNAKPLDLDDVAGLQRILDEDGFGRLVAHAPYTYNPCSAKERAREFALEAMAEDLQRMEALPGQCYNFHPGAHVGQGVDTGIELIVDTLCQVMFEGQRTCVLLETMAGKGTEVGRTFEELARIIEGVARDGPSLRRATCSACAWIPVMFPTAGTTSCTTLTVFLPSSTAWWDSIASKPCTSTTPRIPAVPTRTVTRSSAAAIWAIPSWAAASMCCAPS